MLSLSFFSFPFLWRDKEGDDALFHDGLRSEFDLGLIDVGLVMRKKAWKLRG